ncbi:SHOCT domain-containing protein [Desulfosarcina sp. OttesenSCG-928-A07]|nr:SHOCT domain-containing protein [Desulfosarcina sp. OttesenSCG-928-A07]
MTRKKKKSDKEPMNNVDSGDFKEKKTLSRGVLIAYSILGLHVVLIGGIVVLVLFLGGILNHMTWILLGGLGLITLSAFFVIRRIRSEKKSLQDMVQNPLFGGRALEVSFLGGMATIKLSAPSDIQAIGYDSAIDVPLLESPESSKTSTISQLTQLARLLEKDLITVDEFNEAKHRLLNS